MFSRHPYQRSNLQNLGHLSKSCPAMNSPVQDDHYADDESKNSAASLTNSLPDNEEEAAPPISRAEKQLARQSLRRAKEREVQQQRNLEKNRISMDDFLRKQAQFRIWLLEEQNKQAKDLSSPKLKTYFKMFVRLWNKRHLPAKFYESRLSRHLDEKLDSPQQKSPVYPNRPKFSLIQNSPVLDPSIFPHTIDLSCSNITVGTLSPFSTFGKSTQSVPLTPLRPLTDCGNISRKSAIRFKISAEPERTATISSHKKMLSLSQERSFDRTVVRWSPRGQPKINPVSVPQCPSPCEHGSVKQTEMSRTEQRMTVTLGNPDQHNDERKDFCGSLSPKYAKIHLADSLFDENIKISSQDLKQESCNSGTVCNDLNSGCSVLKPALKHPEVKGHRRRSRSLDDTPVYAVPSKNWNEGHEAKKYSVLEEDFLSPPPLPPKCFDPHVEGLGVPFAPPRKSVSKVGTVLLEMHTTDLDNLAVVEEKTKNSGNGLFRVKLPWFGKKLSSRRRSRSCEVLSPVHHSSEIRSKPFLSTDENNDDFTIVELERSPKLTHRAFRQPQKLSNEQQDLSKKSKFELKEYKASPVRLHIWDKSANQHTCENAIKREKSLRRYSRSLEQINLPICDCHFSKSSEMVRSPLKRCQSPVSTSWSMQSSNTNARNVYADGSLVPESGEQKPHRDSEAHCDVYEQVKSNIKKELSSLVSRIQYSPAKNSNAFKNVNSSVKVEELLCSPRRLGHSRMIQKTPGFQIEVKPPSGVIVERHHSLSQNVALPVSVEEKQTMLISRASTQSALAGSSAASGQQAHMDDVTSQEETVSHYVSPQDASFSAPFSIMPKISPGHDKLGECSVICEDMNCTGTEPANSGRIPNQSEVPSYKEIIKFPHIFKEVAVSVLSPSTRNISSVCQPLQIVGHSASTSDVSSNLSTPVLTRCTHRRRSRSMSEISSEASAAFRDSNQCVKFESLESSYPEHLQRGSTVDSLTDLTTTSNVFSISDSRDGVSSASCKLSLSFSHSHASTLDTYKGSTYSPKMLSSNCPEKMLSQVIPQNLGKKQSSQAVCRQQSSDEGKEQLEQSKTSQVSGVQQLGVECKASPSVKAILQKFGSSLRSVPQRSRRRSRSVGDFSAIADQDSKSEDITKGSFSSVRAFWTRTQGIRDRDEQPESKLHRKPSTMRHLQQHLYGKNVESKTGSASSHVFDKPLETLTSDTDSLLKDPLIGNTLDSFHDAFKENEVPTSPLQQHNKSFKTDEKGEIPEFIQSSPFVTVRRRSSRNLTAGLPSYFGTKQNLDRSDCPLIDSKNERQEMGKAALRIQSGANIKKEMQDTNRGKKKPKLLPKLLPKPNPQLTAQCCREDTADNQLPTNSKRNPSESNPTYYPPVVSKSRKQNSKEMEEISVPEKINDVGEIQEYRGPVISGGSDSQGNIQVSSHDSQLITVKQKEINNCIQTQTSSRLVDCRSSDIRDESFLVERCSDVKECKFLSTTPQKLHQARTAVKRLSSGKGVKDDTLPAKDSSKTLVRGDAPAGKKGNSRKGIEQDSALVKQRYSSIVSSTVRRQSSGKDQQSKNGTPRRQSNPRRKSSIGGRDQEKLSTKVHRNTSGRRRSNSKLREKETALSDVAPLQGSCSKMSTSFSDQVKRISTGRPDMKESYFVKRFNSTREETKMSYTSVLMKRFNSLRNETSSSFARRRSGGGNGTCSVVKRVSTGNNKTRRESSKGGKQDNARSKIPERSKQGNTASRTSSIRRPGGKATQSPTFMRITHHLGAFDENHSDGSNSDSNGQAHHSQVATLIPQIELTQVILKQNNHSSKHFSDDKEPQSGDKTPCGKSVNTGPPCHKWDSARQNESQEDFGNAEMETDIDAWSEEFQTELQKEPLGNASKMSTLV